MDINIFEYAARHKLRFKFKGLINTEDLFDLTVEELDEIYKGLVAENEKNRVPSLLSKNTANDELMAKIHIVEFIFKDKLDEQNRVIESARKRQERNKIAEILAKKRDESLESKSEAELEQMLRDLS